MPRDVGVLIVAAGRGERLGGTLKQYREVAGVPMLVRALRPFISHPEVCHVVVALPSTHAAAPPEWLAVLAGEMLALVAGGARRSDSVRNALGALREECSVVLVHDAARPFVERSTIDGVIRAARGGEAAIAAIPVTDTLKRTDEADAFVTDTLERAHVWRAQTPQGFPRDLLERAHGAGTSDASDDAVMVERIGSKVRIVPDSPRNFKVTTADDLVLAELWASRPG